MSNEVAKPEESCADCAYHHCKQGCFKRESEKCPAGEGECLFTGKRGIKCFNQRCEHFKQWRPKE